MAALWTAPGHHGKWTYTIMFDRLDVLVASSELENRRCLLHILDSLALNAISCRSVDEAREVLDRQEVDMIFCDESLAGGTYRDLLNSAMRRKGLPVIIALHSGDGDWDEYLEAIRLGAFDAVRYPLQPTDIELAVLRAARESRATVACD
jgi:DNA-binding NtrC family response regulator